MFLNDPVLIKQLFMTSPDLVGNLQPNLGRVLGPGSFFALDGDDTAGSASCWCRRSTAGG